MKKANIDIFDNPHLDLLPYARGITSKTLLLIDDIYVVVGKLGNEIQPYLLNTITPESVNLEFTNE